MFMGCGTNENEPAKEGKGRSVKSDPNQGLWYRKAEARGGSVVVGKGRCTERSCADGLVGVELYCHGAKSKEMGTTTV